MFPSDYASSRKQFRDFADRLNWTLVSQSIPGEGPDGEALTIDAAISPNNSAENVLLVSSGLHGVEAPLGAAVQLAAMDRWRTDGNSPESVRCVFIHGLNPFGFAWGRRVDAANIDPNRNFLLAGESYSGCPSRYPDFDPILNPPRPPARWEIWGLRAWWSRQRFGLPALKEALVVGQYEFPRGVFFGGHGPCATNLALQNNLAHWIGEAARVVHLDFHSGLGRWGTYKLLLDCPLTDRVRTRLDRWFGPENYEQDDSRGIAYQPRGSFGPWCVSRNLAPDYTYLVAEFGTYGSISMLGGLRAENQAHHWGNREGSLERQARERLKELFCPADPGWRRQVLEKGMTLVHRAVQGLERLEEFESPGIAHA